MQFFKLSKEQTEPPHIKQMQEPLSDFFGLSSTYAHPFDVFIQHLSSTEFLLEYGAMELRKQILRIIVFSISFQFGLDAHS